MGAGPRKLISLALALVVHDVAHVTPRNCRAAVRAVRHFARAKLHAGMMVVDMKVIVSKFGKNHLL